MRRGEIPGALLKARRADIGKIPDRVLAKLTRADLASRLLASGEYQRRARVPHLDADLYSYRLGLAREVLETDDPNRAAELVKGAGTGVTAGTGRTAPAAPARRAAAATRVAKSAPAETVTYPALDLLTQKAAAAQSVATALIELAKAGRLGDLERDIAAMRRDVGSGRMELVKGPAPAGGLAKAAGSASARRPAAASAGYAASELVWQRSPAGQAMAKAAEYERKAYVVTDPEMRRGYLELAAQERQKTDAQ